MMRKVGLLIFGLVFLAATGFAQSDVAKIKGKVTDEAGEGVPYATVKIIQNGIIKGGANTDDEGNYSVANLTPGTYSVTASFAGQEKTIENVSLTMGKTKTLDISMSTDVEMGTVEIYEPIEYDQTTTVQSFDKQQVRETGYRDINSVVAIAAGAVPAQGGVSMRGMRATGTTYYIDGVKVRGVVSLPQKAIEQINVITGGTPAEYGDMVGGVISITTAGPSLNLMGGVEVLTSTLFPKPYVGLDPFGYSLVGVNASGPIISKYDSVMDYKKPILGFMIAAEAEYQMDASPTVSFPVLKDDVLSDLQANPLTINETGDFFIQRANFLKSDDFETAKRKTNNEDLRIRVSSRLDFQPVDNIIVKLGLTWEDIRSDSWDRSSYLLSPESNQYFKGSLFRGWLRFQQQFAGNQDSKVKNLFYMVQADYNLYLRQFMNETHKDRIFDYGHVGSFNYDFQEIYLNTYFLPTLHDAQVSDQDYFLTVGYSPANLSYDPSTSKNPGMASYNNYIFDYVSQNGIVNPFSPTGARFDQIPSMDFLRFFGGLRNGDSPTSVYSLYSGTGSSPGGYTKYNFEQYRASGQVSGDFGGHSIKAGFEFEQRGERYFGVAARPLWSYLRQLTNAHLTEISYDYNDLTLVTANGQFQDTVHAPIVYSAAGQTTFDRNLRAKLGLPVDGTDLIVTDNLDPSVLSLDLFDADELLNDGNYWVNYYGYDYTGKRQKRVSDRSFFDDPSKRPMNAFSPTYISGFVQDKFELEDIIFNVGLRVDRFDANQKVLTDNYSLFPTYTAQEAAGQLGISLPGSVGSDWVPYGDNAGNPTSIVGYRDPSTNIWYDATGAPVSSAALRVGGKVQPWIKDDEVTINSFKDYDPQTVVMPRLSFSFPISGEAVFFAHYDVLAQRPGQTGVASSSLLAGQLADYYFLQNSATVSVGNPNLKAERTIDYEIGFKQRLNDFMALSISAFYREMRDLIQVQNFVDAYPLTYSSYNNIDFGTVKGFTMEINMMRKKNIRLNASYTLQFAEGTGSSFSSSRNALNSIEGFSAIRNLLPLDFDRRHRFSGNIDYRFSGPDNRGPGIKMGEKTWYPLSNSGVNTTFTLASGTPYSVNSLPNPAGVQSGINSNIQLAGSPNGSRLPFQFNLDLKIDKSINFGGGVKKDKEGNIVKDSYGTAVKKREYSLNVYLLFLNVLGVKNVLGVYGTSGLPDDDGYLNTGVGQQAVAASIDPESFSYLYSLKANNMYNFSAPRRIRLGIQFSF